MGWTSDFLEIKEIDPEPAGGLIMSSKPNGLKVHSYVKKYAEFKNQTLKTTKSCYTQRITP